jgi:hypothetical protein
MKHAFREQDTPNAEPTREQENTHLFAKSTAEAIKKFNDAMPDKVRKNAVLAVEYLVTGSPEAMKNKSALEQNQYFKDSLKWIEDKHGAKNVIYAGIHRDETTPHMYVYVIPKDENGKLNCRAFFGEKDALSKMQTDFADKVGRKHSLERGLEGSRARHTDIKQYYARVNAATLKTPNIDVPEGKILESKEVYGERVAKSVIAQLSPELVTLRAKAQHTDLAQEQVKIAAQAKAQVELQLAQRDTQLKIEREKHKALRESSLDLMHKVARGGETLVKLQEAFRERLSQEKPQDKDRSR